MHRRTSTLLHFLTLLVRIDVVLFALNVTINAYDTRTQHYIFFVFMSHANLCRCETTNYFYVAPICIPPILYAFNIQIYVSQNDMTEL